MLSGMKKLYLLLGVLALVDVAHATQIPFGPELDARLQQVENKKFIKTTYNVAALGGSSAAAITLGPVIPAGAVILRDYFSIQTAFTGTGATVALSCETANNIFSAASLNNYTAGSTIDGVSTGASTLFKRIAADCPVKATVGTADLTAGKLTLWVEYILTQ